MIDTHCHLNFKKFDYDLDNVVRRFSEKGGEALIVVGARDNSSIKAYEIALKYDICWSSIGIHPHHVFSSLDPAITLLNMSKSINNLKKVVGIGETGLDYFKYKKPTTLRSGFFVPPCAEPSVRSIYSVSCPSKLEYSRSWNKNYPAITDDVKEKQKKLLRSHFELAKSLDLPLILHCREAFDDIIAEVSAFLKIGKIKGVLHCFEGDINQLNQLLEMGFYIGFDGNITYKENQRLRELVINTPLERLLLETDSPYLTPEPLRGKRNEPVNILLTAETVSALKKTTTSNILSITSENANTLFKLVN